MVIYRMLALNIDGTLLQSNGRLSRQTRLAVEYVLEKGIHVTLVTSRSFPSAQKVAKALKLEDYLIAHQGAYIARQGKDNEEAETLLVKRIDENTTLEIVELLEGFHCQMRLVHEKYSLANKVKFKQNLLAKTIVNSGDPLFYVHQFVDSISEKLKEEPCTPPKIEVYFNNHKELTDVAQLIEGMFSEVRVIQVNHDRMDIVPYSASKLNGLLFLANHHGISRKEIVVIGDSEDDKEMIAAAGLGVAMGNSPPEVKEAADWITRTNDGYGVAYTIRELFRKQPKIEFLRKMNIIK